MYILFFFVVNILWDDIYIIGVYGVCIIYVDVSGGNLFI